MSVLEPSLGPLERRARGALERLSLGAIDAVNRARFALRAREGAGPGPPVDLAARPFELSSFAEVCLASDRGRRIAERYALSELRGELGAQTFLGTCFLLDLFEQIRERSALWPTFDASAPLDLLDVGAKDFESAPALHQLFRHLDRGRPREVRLTGIEIDLARRDGRSSPTYAEIARAHLALLSTPGPHRVIAGDLLAHRDPADVITWIHPFLDVATIVRWGLPRRFLRPRDMLEHALGLLRPGGLLVIVNQEAFEERAQIELLESAGARFESFGVVPFFRARSEPAYVHVAVRPRGP